VLFKTDVSIINGHEQCFEKNENNRRLFLHLCSNIDDIFSNQYFFSLLIVTPRDVTNLNVFQISMSSIVHISRPFRNYHLSLSLSLATVAPCALRTQGERMHGRCLCPDSVFANTKTGNTASYQAAERYSALQIGRKCESAYTCARIRANACSADYANRVCVPLPPSLSLSLYISLDYVVKCAHLPRYVIKFSSLLYFRNGFL